MRILVTGAAGFIGFHLSKKLVELGHYVTGLDNINEYYDPRLKYDRLAELGVEQQSASVYNNVAYSSKYHDKLKFIRLNLEDKDNFNKLFEDSKFDSVVNLAAQPGVRYSLENPSAYISSNVVGFLNVLECSRHYKIKHLVYASSSSVYGKNAKIPFEETDSVDNPVSLYAATKKSNELMAHAYSHLYNIPTSGLRFFTVYGPWGRPDMAPMLFANAISNNKAINVFNNGEMSRDFTFIDDIINGIIITLSNPLSKTNEAIPYRIYNIGNGSPISLMEFIAVIEKTIGKTAKKNMMPMQDGDVPRTWADTSRLEMMGYSCNTAINEGVKKFISWYNIYYGN